MGNGPIWKVGHQPGWLVVAVKKMVTDLSGGYAETAEWLDVTEGALFNHLRVDGDWIFPLGRAMVLQRAGGSTHIADTVARHSQGVLVPLTDVDDSNNADINQRLMESIEWIGRHSNFIHKVTADGIIGANERARIEENGYQAIVKFQGHVTFLYRVFCVAEKNDARECVAPGTLANNSLGIEE